MFMLKAYSQNNETGVLEVLENNFFTAQPWWEDLKILKVFFEDFTNHWWNVCEFLEKKRVTNLKIYVSTIIRYSQNLREK